MIKELYNRISATEKSRTRFIAGVVVVIGIIILSLAMNKAEAGGKPSKNYHNINITNNYYEYNDYQESGVSDSDLDSTAAQFMAADAIYCSTSSKKNQAGVGAGYRSGKNGYAAGFCKAVELKGHPVTLGYKVSGASGVSPAHGVGINWTF